ncbi:MAG: hypothetical protein CMP25_02215 [Rickettsiales bacterium]|nr:hypothetical protein [Rickettsiales bacterium]
MKIILLNFFIFVLGNCLLQKQLFSANENDIDKTPIEIYAEGGIEWNKNKKVYIAKKNAEAIKGKLKVRADLLEAFYDENSDKNSDIRILNALGNVLINDNETIIRGGKKASYNIKKEHFIVFGKKISLISKSDSVSSNRKLEFWKKKNIAIATGQAEAIRESKYKINADKLVTHLETLENGDYEIKKIIAYNKVIIKTDNEIAYSDKALYNKNSEICKLFGNVKLKKGESFLTGEYAEMNLKNGISKLLPYPGNKIKEQENRVKALINTDKNE